MNRIETPRLMIRPFVMDDLMDLHHILDRELNWAGPDFTLDQRREKLRSYMALADWGESGCFYGYRAVTLNDTGALIGICGFISHLFSAAWKEMFWAQLFPESDPTEQAYASLELEIGYAMSPRFQGQGYATESAKGFVSYAFDTLGMKRVFASTNRKNEGSINLMKRVGMRIATNQKDPEADWPGVVGVIES